MICPKCNGTGKNKFSYTQRYNVEYPCDYDGCVNGIVHCCDGVQAQLDQAIDETHKGTRAIGLRHGIKGKN